MRNAGSLPMRNARELDRHAVAEMFGWTVAEVYSAAQAYKALYRRQPDSTITFEQYLRKLNKVGVRPNQVGKSALSFQLARFGDAGGYHDWSCRFVLAQVNVAERAETYQALPAARANARDSARRRERRACGCCGVVATPQMLARWHGQRCRASREAA